MFLHVNGKFLLVLEIIQFFMYKPRRMPQRSNMFYETIFCPRRSRLHDPDDPCLILRHLIYIELNAMCTEIGTYS